MGLYAQIAADRTQPVDGDGALADEQFLHGQAAGELKGQCLPTDRDAARERFAQGVDAYRGGGVQAQATEAADAGTALCHQRVAGLAQGIATGVQAQLPAADGDAAEIGLNLIEADQQCAAAGVFVHREVARQAAKAVDRYAHVVAGQPQALGVEVGAEVALQAQARQTADGSGPADRAAALTAIEIEAAAAALQGHAGAARTEGHLDTAGLDIPDAVAAAGVFVEHDLEVAGQACGAEIDGALDRDLPASVGHIDQGLLALVDGRQRNALGLVAGPVENCARVVFDQVAGRVDGLVQAQLGAAQVGQRLAHDLDAAEMAQSGQPALAGVGRVFGEHHGQVGVAELRQRAAAAGITQGQAGAAQDGLLQCHCAAAGQGLADASLDLQEHLATELQAGHAGAGLTTDPGLVVKQADAVAAAAGADLQTVDGAAHAVVGHPHAGGREVDA